MVTITEVSATIGGTTFFRIRKGYVKSDANWRSMYRDGDRNEAYLVKQGERHQVWAALDKVNVAAVLDWDTCTPSMREKA